MKITLNSKTILRIVGTYSRRLYAIALVAVIGFSIAACDNDPGNGNSGGGSDGGGTLTITNIPDEYNGKFALYESVSQDGSMDLPLLLGLQSFNMNAGYYTAVQILNGSVSLPMWVMGNSGYIRFSGNRTVSNNKNTVLILHTATVDANFSGSNVTFFKQFQYVIFSNGNASISWE